MASLKERYLMAKRNVEAKRAAKLERNIGLSRQVAAQDERLTRAKEAKMSLRIAREERISRLVEQKRRLRALRNAGLDQRFKKISASFKKAKRYARKGRPKRRSRRKSSNNFFNVGGGLKI